MGNSSSTSPERESDRNDTPVLENAYDSHRRNIWRFHPSCHGNNISISSDRQTARRAESFCNAIVFSDRPFRIQEKIRLKFTQTTDGWSGVIRFGFTTQDPNSIQASSLPRYACPDLTNLPGYWAKALPERYAERNNILCYYVRRDGSVCYSVNNEDKGLFFAGVDTSSPLWGLVDVYGNSTEIRIIDGDQEEDPNDAGAMALDPSDIALGRLGLLDSNNALENLTLESEGTTDEVDDNYPNLHRLPDILSDVWGIPRDSLQEMQFSTTSGANVIFRENRTVAKRRGNEFCKGVTFTSRPLEVDETIFVQVIEVTPRYLGGLAFGVTSCDPQLLNAFIDLPDDSESLMDRPEYWVIYKDLSVPDEGDQLTFTINSEGELRHHVNGVDKGVLIHVDVSQRLWLVFDVYGSTQAIRILGTLSGREGNPWSSGLSSGQSSEISRSDPFFPPLPIPTAAELEDNTDSSSASVPTTHNLPPPPMVGTRTTGRSDCTICYDRPTDSAVYPCGHMCLCHKCGQLLKRQRGGMCPICRGAIRDIIKIFKA
ncbi:PREDICTED: protein neuralized-like [Branchiostoma belcheri]|uniref:Protein neuralized-like n=1 Tax=Branchiostoma belcheri TaxID=7741 RepID=A0A6P4Z2R4_BRABE|nr:PREDICTED: protein neuralized-like [Branchiostoma belcheri]